jgi:2-oxoisovalerate ferredoxin oxidoreductase beta subunit
LADFEITHGKSPLFYDNYERKSEMQHQTHYCPGCGHGLVHKLIAEALQELNAQDDTIFVSPVGCSVFAYYYFDTGNVQAAHGRAPAVATAVKRAHPEKMVISYQGDGDLAAIGTAEIIHAANRGENITVFFVNNGIYGMTGGQLAPTTLVGEKSTTSPWGRRPSNEGFPLHVSELLSTLEAPVYIERVALSDTKNIMKARKAIKHALELQQKKAGFTLVEILSPCPTIWKKDPIVAKKWIAEKMIPAFPLNVFRQKEANVPVMPVPQRPIADAIEIGGEKIDVPRAKHHTRDLQIKCAGFGGQGVLTLGILVAEMGMREDIEVSWLPSYGPEMRSGSAHCHVCLSHERIGSPLITSPDVLIAMNEISLRKFSQQVAAGGIILYNRDSLPPDFSTPQARVICIPASEMADKLGSAKVMNVVMLGALLEETECLPFDMAEAVLNSTVKRKEFMEMNRKALQAGRDFIANRVRVGAVSQPDGFAY